MEEDDDDNEEDIKGEEQRKMEQRPLHLRNPGLSLTIPQHTVVARASHISDVSSQVSTDSETTFDAIDTPFPFTFSYRVPSQNDTSPTSSLTPTLEETPSEEAEKVLSDHNTHCVITPFPDDDDGDIGRFGGLGVYCIPPRCLHTC